MDTQSSNFTRGSAKWLFIYLFIINLFSIGYVVLFIIAFNILIFLTLKERFKKISKNCFIIKLLH